MGGLVIWARVIRVRFLVASLIAVSAGLTIAYKDGSFEPLYAVVTYVGVLSLHASVDLLNDYFDFVQGIDTRTVRTPFSGGTGVLTEGALAPSSVYRAGLVFLAVGIGVGVYLAIFRGPLVLPLVATASLSTYFYSTKLANYGLGELFIAIKGMMIVLGTYYVQTLSVEIEPLFAGSLLGILSASVLYLNEFPDYEADKAGGRKNLIVRLGREKAAALFKIFPILSYSLILIGIWFSVLHLAALLSFIVLPLYLRNIRNLRLVSWDGAKLVPLLARNALSSRTVGVIITLSYLFPAVGLLVP